MATAEQVVEVRGLSNLWEQEVWGHSPPHSPPEAVGNLGLAISVSNLTKLGYFNHNTMLFNHKPVKDWVDLFLHKMLHSIRVF